MDIESGTDTSESVAGELADTQLSDTGVNDTEGNDTESESSADDGVPNDPEELRKGYLRQADYTRKTQTLAEQRKALEAERREMGQQREQMLSLMAQLQAKAEPEPEPEAAPDPAKMKPDEYVRWHAERVAQQIVDAKLKEYGLPDLVNGVRPLLQRETVADAYAVLAEENPEYGDEAFAREVAKTLQSDPELMGLAKNDPNTAVRVAAKLTKAQRDAVAARKLNKARREAAPVAAAVGTSVTRRRESPTEAALRALREEGIVS